MNPLLPALALTACYVLALRAVVLARDTGPAGRFAVQEEAVAAVKRRGPLFRAFDRLSDSLAPRAVGILSERQRAAIRKKLDAAGKPMTLESYAGRKASFVVLFSIVGLLFLLDGSVLMFVLLCVLGWLWMDVTLGGQAARRQARIEKDLPDFLDILAVTVGAGVGFRPAMARVSEALGGPLGEEVLTSLRQMDLGASRREALEGLRKRNQSESLGTFVTALLQAEELGVALAEALTDLAADMRRSFHQKARRRAARAAPRVSLITTTVLVPGAVILIVAALFIGSDLDLGVLGGG
jgi:tight adherence protein C